MEMKGKAQSKLNLCAFRSINERGTYNKNESE